MSTNAYITLHNINDSKLMGSTVTFYRHSDGYVGEYMADMFYQLFDNKLGAKGVLESMICSAPSQVELDSFEPISNMVCNAEFHYHLDLVTMNLEVLNHEYWDENKEVETVFSGSVDQFINQYSGENKAVVSFAEHNKNVLTVFTKESMFRAMFKAADVLKQTIKNPSNPNNRIYTKRLDRFDVFLSDFNLTPPEAETRDTFQRLNLEYQALL